jgi:pyruvate/2-oxoglutarate dehydrogenase complex dihydrolipoamide dehydrogenase (E3) component
VKEPGVPHPAIVVPPPDAHNAALVANVHPPDWKNPTPDGRYNLVVIGAGTAGLITSLVAASLGAKVALVERHLMGGDCLNVGCVPSKALIRSAQLAHDARQRAPDFAAAMERMREIRARISHDDAAKRYRDEFGVEIFFGNARFTGRGSVDVDGTTLAFAKAVVASGARAAAPPVPGLAEAGYLDNETVFALTSLPRRLAVIGAGPIGCELAQAFRRLGAEVSLFDVADQILIREDPDAAAIVQQALVREGVELVLGARLERVERRGSEKLVHVAGRGALAFDEILVGAGRKPNVEALGLEAAGVAYDPARGIAIDDFLRTTNPRIYAAGDCAMEWKFTHAADAAAKLVVQNALFSFGPIGRKRLSALVMPWCTYTDPEVAHVGLYERDAEARGIALDTYQVPIARANRAVTDGQEDGLVKLHAKRGTGEVVGATVVAAHAGELITQLTLAITQKIPLGAFASVIYPYPTQGEAIKAAAGLHTRARLTPRVKRLFTALMRLRR